MPVKHKLLRGLGAGKYLGFATQKLARLATEACEPRSSRTKRYTVDNSMVDIKVSIQDEQHYVKITRRTCPPFLSGICELVLHKEGDRIGAEVPLTPIYQIEDPDNPATTIDVFRRFYPSPATPAADRAWRDEPFLAQDPSAAVQMISLCGSMFSGEMRKVVQVLQGRNVVIPYSPLFNGTHGVFKSASGARWIIEISNQGVFAWRMNICPNPILGANGEVLLPYNPLPSPKPADQDGDSTAAILAGLIRVLAAPSQVQEAFNQNPFYLYSGWAFDENGHHAANCVWNYVGPQIRSFIYTITISEVEDLPTSITLAKTMEGQLTGGISAHAKYPADGPNLYSFDHRLGGDPTGQPGPVFCFYDGTTLVWVRRQMVVEPSTSIEEVPDTDCTNRAFPAGIGIPFSCLGATNCSSQQTITKAPYFEGFGISARASTSSGSQLCRAYAKDEYAGMLVGGSNLNEIWWISQTQEQTSHNEQLKSVIVVPFGDREGFYYAEQLTRLNGQTTHQYDRGGGYFEAGVGAVVTKSCTHSPFSAISYRVAGPLGPVLGFGYPNLVIIPFITGGTQYYPGAHVEEEIEQYYDFGEGGAANCITPKRQQVLATGPPPGLDHYGLQWTSPANTVATYKVMYRGSDGLQIVLPEDDSAAPFVSFLELIGSQAIIARRDAFSDKILLYERPNHFAYRSTAAEYPGFPENRPVCFVGVP